MPNLANGLMVRLREPSSTRGAALACGTAGSERVLVVLNDVFRAVLSFVAGGGSLSSGVRLAAGSLPGRARRPGRASSFAPEVRKSLSSFGSVMLGVPCGCAVAR
eukprot:scaffold273721_cov36-Tisochrysis_lutea.AAC.5